MNYFTLANTISKIEDMAINEQNLICQLKTNHILKYSITCNNTTSKKKEFDINKLISKERTKFQIPDFQKVKEYFFSKGLSEDLAQDFYDFNNNRNWERNDGVKIKSWKSAVSTFLAFKKKTTHKPPVNEKNIKDILSNL